jgi:tetratricopeptide (TPR) repeat protein
MENKYARKADALYQEHRFREAGRYYDLAIRHYGEHPEWLSRRGICAFHNGDSQKALHDLNRAAELEPDHGYRFSSRAWMKEATGNTDGAMADYKRALEIDPEDAISWNNLGMLEEKMGKKRTALEYYQKADQLGMPDATKAAPGPSDGVSIRPKNIQREINREQKALKQQGTLGIMASVFTNRQRRKEFVRFIRNGLRNKD